MAAARHAKLVGAARADDASFWAGTVRGQVFMGDDDFMARMLSRDKPARLAMCAIPKAQPGTVRNWSQHRPPVVATTTLPCAPVWQVSRLIAVGE